MVKIVLVPVDWALAVTLLDVGTSMLGKLEATKVVPDPVRGRPVFEKVELGDDSEKLCNV